MKRSIRCLLFMLAIVMLLGAAVPAMAASREGDYERCDHEWDSGKTVRHRTCTRSGVKQYTCKRCGATKTASYGEPLGHDWGKWSEWKIEGATATRTHTCQRCHLTRKEQKKASELPEGGMGGGAEEPALYLSLGVINGPQDSQVSGGYVECEYTLYNPNDFSVEVNAYQISKPDGTDTSNIDLFNFTKISLGPSWGATRYMYIKIGTDDPVERTFFFSGTCLDSEMNSINTNTVAVKMEFNDPTDQLELTVDSVYVPLELKQNAIVTADLSLTNKGKRDVMLCNFYLKDPLKPPSGLDSFVTQPASLKPNETVSFSVNIVVTPEDANDKKVSRYVQIGGVPYDDNTKVVYSNKGNIEYTTEPDQQINYNLKVEKIVTNLPKKGYFEKDDIIHYIIKVTNIGTGTYDSLTVKDAYEPGDAGFGGCGTFVPQATCSFPFALKAEEKVITNGKVINEVTVIAIRDTGEKDTYSAKAEAPVGSIPPEVHSGLKIVKKRTGQPNNGSFYEPGETIHYLITVTNTGEDTITVLSMTDSLSLDGNGHPQIIATYPSLVPNGVWTFPYSYVVQPSDVAASNQIENTAFVAGTNSIGWPVMVASGTVYADIGETLRRVDPGTDLCAFSLIAGEEGTLACAVSHCTEHAGIARQAEAILNKAGTDAEALTAAYEEIAEIWKKSIDALYDRILSVAGTGSAVRIVQKEKAAFYAMTDAYAALMAEEWPEAPEIVAQKKADMFREKCAELCWFTRSRENMLPDSLLEQAVPQHETEECSAELKTQSAELLLYALRFCPKHTNAALTLHAALTDALNGGTAADAFTEARVLWEKLTREAEERLPGTAGAALQQAFDAHRDAYVSFVRLFCSSKLCAEEARAKLALTEAMRLCPLAEQVKDQGGVAPKYIHVF